MHLPCTTVAYCTAYTRHAATARHRACTHHGVCTYLLLLPATDPTPATVLLLPAATACRGAAYPTATTHHTACTHLPPTLELLSQVQDAVGCPGLR